MARKYLKYIRLYENFKSLFEVKVYDYDEFYKLVYGDNGMLLDKTIFERIEYMDSSIDFAWNAKDINPYFIVLLKEDKIIGVAKIGHYPYKPNNRYSLAYLSIDKEYQGLGYSKLIVDKLFNFLKENGYSFDTSKYTDMGSERLKKSLIEYSNKYNVEFIDNE